MIVMGVVTVPFGVKGWIRLKDFSADDRGLGLHPVWHLSLAKGDWIPFNLERFKIHGKGAVAKLETCDDCDSAEKLRNARIAVPRDSFPALPKGEYYWCDLIGLEMFDRSGRSLGTVSDICSTQAHPILKVNDDQREELIPFVDPIVDKVDLDSRRIVVDWESEED